LLCDGLLYDSAHAALHGFHLSTGLLTNERPLGIQLFEDKCPFPLQPRLFLEGGTLKARTLLSESELHFPHFAFSPGLKVRPPCLFGLAGRGLVLGLMPLCLEAQLGGNGGRTGGSIGLSHHRFHPGFSLGLHLDQLGTRSRV
jgi:hypothetical protein